MFTAISHYSFFHCHQVFESWTLNTMFRGLTNTFFHFEHHTVLEAQLFEAVWNVAVLALKRMFMPWPFSSSYLRAAIGIPPNKHISRRWMKQLARGLMYASSDSNSTWRGNQIALFAWQILCQTWCGRFWQRCLPDTMSPGITGEVIRGSTQIQWIQSSAVKISATWDFDWLEI